MKNMKAKYKKKFNSIADRLYKINQNAIKDNDESAKMFSCYLIEQIDARLENEE